MVSPDMSEEERRERRRAQNRRAQQKFRERKRQRDNEPGHDKDTRRKKLRRQDDSGNPYSALDQPDYPNFSEDFHNLFDTPPTQASVEIKDLGSVADLAGMNYDSSAMLSLDISHAAPEPITDDMIDPKILMDSLHTKNTTSVNPSPTSKDDSLGNSSALFQSPDNPSAIPESHPVPKFEFRGGQQDGNSQGGSREQTPEARTPQVLATNTASGQDAISSPLRIRHRDHRARFVEQSSDEELMNYFMLREPSSLDDALKLCFIGKFFL
ncbi:hypothetical protein MRS44_003895 [Fusarium solani]|uniref:uncharacterized protein n=1 Tax=Fusarium solani TaxID=169388 RepID=UPI0032C3E65B|nr:hypothetical protein MRS44_003895 [Fusarium solani]